MMDAHSIEYRVSFNRDSELDWFRLAQVEAVVIPEKQPGSPPKPDTRVPQSTQLERIVTNTRENRTYAYAVAQRASDLWPLNDDLNDYKLQHKNRQNLTPAELQQVNRERDYWVYDENEPIFHRPDPEELELYDELTGAERDEEVTLPASQCVVDIQDGPSGLSVQHEETIGNVFGRVIRRHGIQRDFWERMEEPSQDTSNAGFDVFDRYGFLQRAHIEGAKCGSGVWGRELDDGNFLHIEIVNVKPTHRRRGIAKTMISRLVS